MPTSQNNSLQIHARPVILGVLPVRSCISLQILRVHKQAIPAGAEDGGSNPAGACANTHKEATALNSILFLSVPSATQVIPFRLPKDKLRVTKVAKVTCRKACP